MKTLRPYQERAVEAFLATEDGHATLKMFTGSGKTLIGINVIRVLQTRHSDDLAVLVVTPTIDLKDQWRRVFQEEGFSPEEIPEIVTYAMAAKHVDQIEVRNYDLIVFDEMHHLGDAPVFGQLLVPAFKARYALGLSATPPENPENYALRVMPVIFERTYKQGLDEGYAAPFTLIPTEVQLTEFEQKRYRELTNNIRDMIAKYGENYHARPFSKDPLTGETIWGATLTNERRQLIANASQKFDAVLNTIWDINSDALHPGMNMMAPARILVWSEYIETLESMHEYLSDNGVQCRFLHGEVPKKERKATWAAWGTEFQVLLLGKLGEEGIDYPTLDIGIVIAGSKTSRQSIQRIGRLLRPTPGKVAKLWLIYAGGTNEVKLRYLMDEVTR